MIQPAPPYDPHSETLDALFHGHLHLIQPKHGYRFSLDAYLLAYFAPKATGPTIELGTGSGVVSLALLALEKARRITAVELQPELAAIARRNAMANGFAERLEIVEADLRHVNKFLPSQKASLVLANPPFYPKNAGRECANEQEAIARREWGCTLSDVVLAARYALKGSGRACFVYPAARLAALFGALEAAGFGARRLRAVHPSAAHPAKLILLEAIPSAKTTLHVEAPLLLAEVSGQATHEARLVTGGPWAGAASLSQRTVR